MSTIMQLLLMVSCYVVSGLKWKNWNPLLTKLPIWQHDPVYQPEKGLFILMLCLGALLNFPVMLLRYIHINSIYPKKYKKTNMASFTCGIVMLLQRLSIPAFSMTYSQIEYEASTAVYTVFSFIFIVTQTQMSRKLHLNHGRHLITFRLVMTVSSFVCILAYVTGRAMKYAIDNKLSVVITRAAELAFDISVIIYISSFYFDFKRVRFRSYNSDKISAVGVMKEANVNKTFNYVDYLRNQARSRSIISDILTEFNSDVNL